MARKKKKNPYEQYGLQAAGVVSDDGDWKYSDNPYEAYGMSQTKRERDPSLIWDWDKPSQSDVASKVVQQKQNDDDDDEDEDKPKERERSVWERLGDVFEANSPEDKAKRKARGEAENYQEQKRIEKEVRDRSKRLDFSKEDVKERKEYYQRQGVDLEKGASLRSRYNNALREEVKSSEFDFKEMAEQAKEEGLFDDNEEALKDFEAAPNFSNPNMQSQFYRQAIIKALDDYSTERLSKIENDYWDYKASQKPGGEALPQQINRNFQRGLVEAIAKFPRSAQTMLAGAGDLVAPEGSRVDKFAQEQYDQGKQGIADMEQHLIDQGVGMNPDDNEFAANISSGS